MLARAILLGPQRHVPMVKPAVDFLAPPHDGAPIAVVTAGWEEREAEDQEFKDHMQRPVQNLEIWRRVEQIFERDPELLTAMRTRHDTLRKVQELYRLRLVGLMDAARALLRRIGDSALLEPERQGALEMVQKLDRDHVARVAAIHEEFEARWHPADRREVIAQRQQIAALVEVAPCVCIAGGHVAVLLHRLRLFDLLALIGRRPVVAWSAGAMILLPRIVLFHDDPPQGSADPEVMEAGLAALPGLVVFPHARRRLKVHDQRNAQLMARRFEPDVCALLDEGSRLDFDGTRWSAPAGTLKLTDAGRLQEVGA
ncbi:MAG: Type 1 glutamine amidotransferase-like domain-containing protein [Planctomycetes bacterium]|nr:Type 1 glutamine amidotransferase-like domain-containing protein [Planctomycetota bacterium]